MHQKHFHQIKMRMTFAFVVLIFAVGTFVPETVFTATAAGQPNRLKNALLRKKLVDYATKKVPAERLRQTYEEEEEEYEDEEEEEEAEEELQQQALNTIGEDYNEGGEDDDEDEDEEVDEEEDEGRKLTIRSITNNDVADEALKEIKIESFVKQLICKLFEPSKNIDKR